MTIQMALGGYHRIVDIFDVDISAQLKKARSRPWRGTALDLSQRPRRYAPCPLASVSSCPAPGPRPRLLQPHKTTRDTIIYYVNSLNRADHAARNPTFPDETGLVSPMRPPSPSPSSPASSAPSTPQPVDSLSPDDPILIDQEPAPSSIRRGHKTAMTEAKQKELQAKYPWCRFSGGCNEKGTPQAHCSTCLEHKPNSSLFAKASGGGGAVTCEAELAQHAKSKAHSEAIGMAQRAGGGAGSIKAAVKAATTKVVQGTYRRMVLAALLWGHSAMSFAAHLQFATHTKPLLTQQLAAVRASPYFSLLADSSTDVGTEDHLLLYVRYLEPSSFIYHTSFLCAVKVVGATSHVHFPLMMQLAQVMLLVPLQTAVVERGFSIHRIINHRLTNRLKLATVDSLMRIRLIGPSKHSYQKVEALIAHAASAMDEILKLKAAGKPEGILAALSEAALPLEVEQPNVPLDLEDMEEVESLWGEESEQEECDHESSDEVDQALFGTEAGGVSEDTFEASLLAAVS
ncbi:hypothetical protein QJQ45_004985 [Haematococcus lacustris]|nr:hypothetical protein QJQ45_004985 [Haematococcus lacustris]